MSHDSHNHNPENDKLTHIHIVPEKTALKVGFLLFVLTIITVAVSRIDLGALNMIVAVAVASIKAGLVAFIFMGLAYDRKENAAIFLTSFVFLGIFIVLTSSDLLFRGNVYTNGRPLFAQTSQESKFKKPWIRTDELVARGKEVFAANCTACHGAEGLGNGPASGALNPKPRNFHENVGWKNHRSPAGIFKTLKEGVAGGAMASYATLPTDDRWSLAHYVLSLGPSPDSDSATDFAAIQVDPTKETMGAVVAKTIPVDFVLDRMTEKDEAKQ